MAKSTVVLTAVVKSAVGLTAVKSSVNVVVVETVVVGSHLS